MYDPTALLQVAFAWQGLLEHSSISKMNKKATYEDDFFQFWNFTRVIISQ